MANHEAGPITAAERKLIHQTAFIVYKLLLKGENHELYTPDLVAALRLDYEATMREAGLPMSGVDAARAPFR